MQGLNIWSYTQFIWASPTLEIASKLIASSPSVLRNWRFYILHIYVFETLLYTLSYVKEKKNTLLLGIGDHNTTYVFAANGTHVAYLNLKYQ